jgi:apolipoprotein N-acyltransferase
VGITLTGFAWMQPGYTQIDLPLAGYAPLLGNHAVGGLVAVTAGALLAGFNRQLSWPKAAAVIGVIWLAGFALKQVSWTQPAADEIEVALIQGNIPQELKWKRQMHSKTLAIYRELSLQHKDVDLIIWPETAIPDYKHRVPVYLLNMRQAMQQSDTDLLMGLFIKNLDTGRYYNSVISAHGGEYRKRHLVPLGEYIPMRSLIGFFNRWINIPMSDIDSGKHDQPLLVVAGQPVGVSICFEDIFSRDVRRDLPEATLLVNVSNDAWFDGSHESRQHHAIARMRALESGRYMLRTTNTGITSIIGPKGEEIQLAPPLERHVLRGSITPLKGVTPYVFWGDAFILVIAGMLLGGICFWPRFRKSD